MLGLKKDVLEEMQINLATFSLCKKLNFKTKQLGIDLFEILTFSLQPPAQNSARL